MLAIESTGKIASVCVLDIAQEKIIGELTLNTGYTHSQTLLPMINNLLELLELKAIDINFVACSAGPGSYTGIKIGAATAKAFAHAHNLKIISVNSLDAMALNIFAPSDFLIAPLIDARRCEIYGAIYKYKNHGVSLTRLCDYLNQDINKIIEHALELSYELDKKIIFLGDGVQANQNSFINLDHDKIFFAPLDLNLQKASSVARHALSLLKLGQNIFSYQDFQAYYLRKHEAEL